MAPLFRIHHHDEAHNRIGTPTVTFDGDGDEIVSVSPGKPTIYTQSRTFVTDKGRYLNLIYRIHFQKIPFRLFPFHLTAGKNVGLFVIITLNDKQKPVLVTTVHTCGCYMASIPTTNLPEASRPDDWPSNTVPVYGETLPSILPYDTIANPRLLVTIRPDVHRVMNLEIVDQTT
jgi:hypothetical protein